MIVIKRWRRVKYRRNVPYGTPHRDDHIYTGWFLFGIIPIFINRDTTWHVRDVS